MIDRINKLIEVNLSLLFSSENHTLNLKDFKDDVGKRLKHTKVFTELMQQKGLITVSLNGEFSYELTSFGKHIVENGGWLEHLKKLKNKENQIQFGEFQNSQTEIKPFNRKLFVANFLIVLLAFLIALFYSLFD